MSHYTPFLVLIVLNSLWNTICLVELLTTCLCEAPPQMRLSRLIATGNKCGLGVVITLILGCRRVH